MDFIKLGNINYKEALTLRDALILKNDHSRTAEKIYNRICAHIERYEAKKAKRGCHIQCQ